MPVSFEMNESNSGTVSGSIFSHQESGSTLTEDVGSRVANLDTRIARGSTRGPSTLFTYRVFKRALDLFLVILFFADPDPFLRRHRRCCANQFTRSSLLLAPPSARSWQVLYHVEVPHHVCQLCRGVGRAPRC